ncbi:hypothetical protein BT67DRAFT_102150 [Trichocladium antarcticum]|uniref:Uncharacterized protein n=1 Tax=Trichocladium antarcticum TaxID=1450529 RepID=A0AAN6UR53_9PEZI|nr:hypothetical protein BT67DRAFT_102150 [Trichocladium antarcticum]
MCMWATQRNGTLHATFRKATAASGYVPYKWAEHTCGGQLARESGKVSCRTGGKEQQSTPNGTPIPQLSTVSRRGCGWETGERASGLLWLRSMLRSRPGPSPFFILFSRRNSPGCFCCAALVFEVLCLGRCVVTGTGSVSLWFSPLCHPKTFKLLSANPTPFDPSFFFFQHPPHLTISSFHHLSSMW